VRRKVGLVPANRHRQGLIMTQSVRQNMTLPTLRTFARCGRIDRKAEIGAVEDAVVRFGVKTHSAESGVASLSGGNQQKVVLAKWLGIGPKVLLLDEPTQGVDVAAQADLHQLLIDAAAEGAAIVVCSSDEFELSQVCDRVLVMTAGSVHTELVGGDATAHQIFRATLGEKSPEAEPKSAVPLLISE
jgi:ribose transport system ATP-binding protein